jgi:peptidoglycan/xylan/chitin deacetylase (PgdA/CDA1 family)/uncharacterized caspase-like protein
MSDLRCVFVILALLVGACSRTPTDSVAPKTPAIANASADAAALAQTWQASAQVVVDTQRQILVLLADEEKANEQERRARNHVAHQLFHTGVARTQALKAALQAEMAARPEVALPALDALLTQIESEPAWFDADRLAAKDILLGIREALQGAQTLNAIKMHRRAGEDLETIGEIESLYEREMKAVFGRFETRAIELRRERWDDYLAKVRRLHSVEKILRDHALILPSPALAAAAAKAREMTGSELPPKTLLLTFDDGPHSAYTDEILSILKQHDAKAVFFQVGKNLGEVTADGSVKLGKRAEVSRRILAEGHTLANHSYSHAQLSQAQGATLNDEIAHADRLLKAVSAQRSNLFRFPYGARNEQALQALSTSALRSMMWNIDSRDWADPIATSIADRVLRSVRSEGRGIVLFHDIHERTVKALPMVMEQLKAEGYRFAHWQEDAIAVAPVSANAKAAALSQPLTASYQNSWAIVVGVNDYEHWPKLAHAVQDANAIHEVLSLTLGFDPRRIQFLNDKRATRAAILAAFRDLAGQVGKDDRVFVFFAGHGATRRLASGRSLGYIVPVDAKRDTLDADAIAMTELQNLADALPAKHVFFVMDACYSGLGLTRGANDRFLRDNARRIGRQMLTAGGADQLVADNGPAGHSVFTWTLLQALGGRADSNADGYITATEIAAFVAPAVASISQQTPAFGSLPGAQGGEFIFVRPQETEDLTAKSAQFNAEAIGFNAKLAVAPTAPKANEAPTKLDVPSLDGGKTTLIVPRNSVQEPRQMAYQANDVGLKLYREKRYAQAEQAFADALSFWPTYAQAANNLGFVYHRQGRFPEAKRWFEATIAMDPSRAIAYLNLGDALIAMGEHEAARKVITTYIMLAPNDGARKDGQARLSKLPVAKVAP